MDNHWTTMGMTMIIGMGAKGERATDHGLFWSFLQGFSEKMWFRTY